MRRLSRGIQQVHIKCRQFIKSCLFLYSGFYFIYSKSIKSVIASFIDPPIGLPTPSPSSPDPLLLHSATSQLPPSSLSNIKSLVQFLFMWASPSVSGFIVPDPFEAASQRNLKM